MIKVEVKALLISKMNPLYKKELYGSDEVASFITSFDRIDRDGLVINPVLKKLDYLAKRGFDVDNYIIIYYQQYNVYRIRVKGINRDARIIGFYDNNKFIAISCFYKNTQQLTNKQIHIIKKVSSVFHNEQWIYRIGG